MDLAENGDSALEKFDGKYRLALIDYLLLDEWIGTNEDY